MVLERESIRTLCDKLRRERDRAVSELAEALRDLDEVKKNRNELNKENKDLREKMENVEKDKIFIYIVKSADVHNFSLVKFTF